MKIKKGIFNKDLELLLSKTASVPHLCHVHAVAADSDCSWPKVWDTFLDCGPLGTWQCLACSVYGPMQLFCSGL